MVLLVDTMGELVLALVKLVLRSVQKLSQLAHFLIFLTDSVVLELTPLLESLVVTLKLF